MSDGQKRPPARSFTERGLSALVEPGVYRDGATTGLYFQVKKPTVRSWLLKFTIDGKGYEMGLGPYPTVTLAKAREKAAEARKQLAEGVNPLAERRKAQAEKRLEVAKALTFAQAVEKCIAAKSPEWRNEKHKAQWQSSLKAYAYPKIGEMPISAVDTDAVVRVLRPIWLTLTETATRLRQRIEVVLDWAVTAEHRPEGANPARWRGHLENMLAKPSKVRKVAHHPALPHDQLPDFWQELAGQDSVAAQCLKFTILTAARTGESIAAKWDEIDLDKAVWTIPAARMKAGKEHRVPLSDQALAVLKALRSRARDDGFVFPGMKKKQHLSNMAMLRALERMGHGNVTVHGFRSSFRDWASERTNYAREVAEAALAHTIEDKTEAAYRRGDLFEKRAKLMQAWADFATTPQTEESGKVVPFKKEAGA